MLYHGSTKPGLKVLLPFPRKEMGDQPFVFASDDRRFALAMIHGTDADFSVGYTIDKSTGIATMEMTEARKDGFSMLNAPGFLYEVEGTGFTRDPRLSYHEFISPNEVPVVKETPIANVLNELKKSDILFTPYAS